LIEKAARFIGPHTNNEAEYEGLLWGIEKVRERSCANLRVVSDSELIVRQTLGEYKVKEDRLRKYAERVAINKRLFDTFDIVHAHREDPRIAIVDEQVNRILNEKGYPKK
jgi:ribonuclease HI